MRSLSIFPGPKFLLDFLAITLSATLASNAVFAQNNQNAAKGETVQNIQSMVNARSLQWYIVGMENLTSTVRGDIATEPTPSGKSAESWTLGIPDNSSVLLGFPLDFPVLIEEFDPVVKVCANRPGIALGAQVVLPYTIHPQTGQPVSFMVSGGKSAQADIWQELAFRNKNGTRNFLTSAEQTARYLLRAEMGIQGDLREMYVRQLVLYVEGDNSAVGPNAVSGNFAETRVLIDTVSLPGAASYWNRDILDRYEYVDDPHSGRRAAWRFDPVNLSGFKIRSGAGELYLAPSRSEHTTGATVWEENAVAHYRSPGGELLGVPATAMSASAPHSGTPYRLMSGRSNPSVFGDPVSENEIALHENSRIQMSNQSIVVDGNPIGVRAIEYRGEPLQFLKDLKFNAVYVHGTPSFELLLEAKRVGIFLICSPPALADLEAMDNASASSSASSGQRSVSGGTLIPLTDAIYDNVLVWNIGDQCLNTETAISGYYRLCKAIRAADRRRTRPLLCGTDSGIQEYSRFVEILLMRRNPMFTTFDLRNYPAWQETILQHLAVPATPTWSTIQTQPDPRMVMQWELFGGNVGATPRVLYEQIQLMVHMAIAGGSHGLIFTSHTPLTANDPETRYRCLALEQINLELSLIEEWFSKGQKIGVITSNRRTMESVLLQTSRSRLLLPIWKEPHSQNAIGPAFEANVSYIIPGIPDDYEIFHLVPGGVRPLDAERVAGGVKITLDKANLNSLIFFTSDPVIRGHIERRSREQGARSAHLACRLAWLQHAAFEETFTLLRRAQAAGEIPERDRTPLIGMEEQESLLNITKTAIELCETLFERQDYASAYLQAEEATRGIRAASRDLWLTGTRYDLHSAMTPVSVSFPNLPLYLETYNRSVGAQRDANRLWSGTAEDLSQWTSEWMTSKHRLDGIAAEAMLSRNAARSGLSGLEMVVRPSDPAVPVPVVETAPIWAMTSPGIPVQMGEVICVSGWINIPRPIRGSYDGVMIFDNLGGDALALRFRRTDGWQRFALYRVAPGTGQMHLTLSLCGLGTVYFDDIEITSVRFGTEQPPQTIPEQPGGTPFWQRLNPLQLIPQGWGGTRGEGTPAPTTVPTVPTTAAPPTGMPVQPGAVPAEATQPDIPTVAPYPGT